LYFLFFTNLHFFSGKQEKDGHGRKINYNAHQRVFEKVFISSVVEAELGQRPGGRGSPRGSLNDVSIFVPCTACLVLAAHYLFCESVIATHGVQTYNAAIETRKA